MWANCVPKGEALWRLAYAAIATSWPEMIHHKRELDSCSGVELVQTALLSQVYAAMSKVNKSWPLFIVPEGQC